MRSFFFKIIIVSFFLSSFLGCDDNNEYRVDTEFESYVVLFEQDALKRNKILNLKTSGLIVEFATLKDNQAGLCHYETPIRIEIDKEYWAKLKGKSGEALMKENLLYHELGHGILNRRHLNTTLENGDWKSIMCGGDKVNERPWNINYRGMRRAYYVDELFNESTTAPSFSTLTLAADTNVFKRKIYLSFDTENKADAGWDMTDNVGYKISIDKKRLLFESKATNSYFIFGQTTVDSKNDFSFEIKMQCESPNKSDNYGLVFGNKDIGDKAIEYFSVNNNSKMNMGNRGWYSFYTELSVPTILPMGINILKIVRLSNILYYFINDKYVYSTESELIDSGNYFGFIVPSKSKLWLDDMQISVLKTSNISPQKSNIAEFEFTIQEQRNESNYYLNY